MATAAALGGKVTTPGPVPTDRGAVPTVGFAIVVVMWAVGYVCRLPPLLAPSWLVLLLMLAAMAGGGFAFGRFGRGSVADGALAGLLAAALNLLILGGLLRSADDGGARSIWIWLPGTLLLGAAIGAAACWVGVRVRAGRRIAPIDWTPLMALVGCGATFLLVIAGGLVTSFGAGLAVPDWPNTYGSLMFLYPLSKMTSGVYYEHAHRLFGSLVGLTTIAVAAQIVRTRREPLMRGLAGLAVLLVVTQGVLGGLRVTGRLTLATEAEQLAPSLSLAIVHGITGQLFFALLAGLVVLSSQLWRRPERLEWSGPRSGFRLAMIALPALMLVQIGLGALVRHRSIGVAPHIALAMILGMYAVIAGTVLWASVRRPPRAGWVGVGLIWLTGIQVALGFAAFVVTSGGAGRQTLGWSEVLVATAHQANGALLLAASVVAALLTARAVGAAAPAPAEVRRPPR